MDNSAVDSLKRWITIFHAPHSTQRQKKKNLSESSNDNNGHWTQLPHNLMWTMNTYFDHISTLFGSLMLWQWLLPPHAGALGIGIWNIHGPLEIFVLITLCDIECLKWAWACVNSLEWTKKCKCVGRLPNRITTAERNVAKSIELTSMKQWNEKLETQSACRLSCLWYYWERKGNCCVADVFFPWEFSISKSLAEAQQTRNEKGYIQSRMFTL